VPGRQVGKLILWSLKETTGTRKSAGNGHRAGLIKFRYAGGRNVVRHEYFRPICNTNILSQVSGTLHWAPESVLDAFYRTTGVRYLKRNDYSDNFHTYGAEWSENYIYTWVDTRIAVKPSKF
jgi:hypothetical protein